jgi:phosphopantetheine adenylyltransferase
VKDILIEEAKKRIEYLEDYIRKIENYKPTTMEEEAVYLYVQLESVTKVAKELNEKGYRVGNRKLNTVDISEIIKSKPADDVHEMAKKMFTRNKKRAAGTGWM